MSIDHTKLSAILGSDQTTEDTTSAAKIANYLYARLRQSSGRYERNDIAALPEWVPCRIRLDSAIHNSHPFERGFILAGDHDCECGIDGRIFVDSDTGVRVRIPVCECEILELKPNTLRDIRLAESEKRIFTTDI